MDTIQHSQHVDWSKMTDAQKTLALLGSTRMPDFENFLGQYSSLEQPDNKEIS